MKTISFFITLAFLFLNLNLLAHKGGHGTENITVWDIEGNTVEASFLTFKDGFVYLEMKTGQLLIRELSSFSIKDRLLIEQKNGQIKKINQSAGNSQIISKDQYKVDYGIPIKFLYITLALLSIFIISYLVRRKKAITVSMGIISSFILIVLACGNDEATDDGTEDDSSTLASVPTNDVATLQEHFGHFSGVSTSADDTYFYVSSSGLPEHDMMEGITNWQQQVPIPQEYNGTNSWAFPLQPVLAETPLSSAEHFLRGAIAIAINGIPIFNPLNNRGEDALSIGELDNWGGHCGRADDYHYHVPPTHLESVVGTDQPIAYALDGFPIYGETTEELDEYLGKFNENGSYQYHTTDTAPYFIAGMRGQVMLDPNTTAPEDQILPQAMTQEVRPALTPLAGAEITTFTSTGANSYSLEYQIGDDIYFTNYSWDENGLYTYEYIDGDGNVTTETYQR